MSVHLTDGLHRNRTIMRTSNHTVRTQPPYTTFHVIFMMNHKLCILRDSLWGWTSSCWGRRAICWKRFASGSRTANRSPTDTEPVKQKRINIMLTIFGSKKNYVKQWLSKESSYEKPMSLAHNNVNIFTSNKTFSAWYWGDVGMHRHVNFGR